MLVKYKKKIILTVAFVSGLATILLFLSVIGVVIHMSKVLKLDVDRYKMVVNEQKQEIISLNKKISDLELVNTHMDSSIKKLVSEKQELTIEYGKKEEEFSEIRKMSRYWYAFDKTKINRKNYMDKIHVAYLLNVIDESNTYMDPHLMLALYDLESGYNQNANTRSGAGYGQLIYSTGKWWYEDKLKLGKYKREYALNPQLNIEITSQYLMYLIKMNNGNLYKALRAYNGNAIGDRYIDLIDKRLKEYTGRGLAYYNRISIEKNKGE